MPYAFCGEGDRWIKTCRVKDGSLLRVCDPCYEALSQWLVIVPGDVVVTARCDQCGAYFNPREMAEFSPGGRYNAYSGTCTTCMKEGTRDEKVTLTQATKKRARASGEGRQFSLY
jgi:transcription elongation factor Elf1